MVGQLDTEHPSFKLAFSFAGRMLLILNKEHFNSQQMSCIETSIDKTNPEYIHIINS